MTKSLLQHLCIRNQGWHINTLFPVLTRISPSTLWEKVQNKTVFTDAFYLTVIFSYWHFSLKHLLSYHFFNSCHCVCVTAHISAPCLSKTSKLNNCFTGTNRWFSRPYPFNGCSKTQLYLIASYLEFFWSSVSVFYVQLQISWIHFQMLFFGSDAASSFWLQKSVCGLTLRSLSADNSLKPNPNTISLFWGLWTVFRYLCLTWAFPLQATFLFFFFLLRLHCNLERNTVILNWTTFILRQELLCTFISALKYIISL